MADGFSSGWAYIDVTSANTWVRGIPVYLSGGDTASIEIYNIHLAIDGAAFFSAWEEKSTQYSFVPSWLMQCVDYRRKPSVKLAGRQIDYVPSVGNGSRRRGLRSIAAGLHTINIYSLFDNVIIHHRSLYDIYTVNKLGLCPVSMN